MNDAGAGKRSCGAAAAVMMLPPPTAASPTPPFAALVHGPKRAEGPWSEWWRALARASCPGDFFSSLPK